MRGDSGYANQMRNVASAVIPVVAGDWFDLAVYIGTAGELRSLERTWFAIEAVETDDAAKPPADHVVYKPGLADILTRQERTALMSRIRGANTKPELFKGPIGPLSVARGE